MFLFFWITPIASPLNQQAWLYSNPTSFFFVQATPLFSTETRQIQTLKVFSFWINQKLAPPTGFQMNKPLNGQISSDFPMVFPMIFPSQSVVSPWLFPYKSPRNPRFWPILQVRPPRQTHDVRLRRLPPPRLLRVHGKNHPARAKRATRSGRPLPGDVGAIDGTEMVFTIVDFDNYS